MTSAPISLVSPLPRPQCTTHADCPDDRVCRSHVCDSPCDECGVNTNCNVVEHRAVCICPRGYQGDPRVQCSRGEIKMTALNAELGKCYRVSRIDVIAIAIILSY